MKISTAILLAVFALMAVLQFATAFPQPEADPEPHWGYGGGYSRGYGGYGGGYSRGYGGGYGGRFRSYGGGYGGRRYGRYW